MTKSKTIELMREDIEEISRYTSDLQGNLDEDVDLADISIGTRIGGKMRSIYDNPYKYACICNVPFELAKIACLKQRHWEKMQQKHPMRCPHCNSKHLIFEMGSYEEGYDDFIECDNCGDTFDCSDVPNAKYANLTGWEDFDPVVFFSTATNKAEGWKEACGAETLEEWHEYARKMIIGKR